MNGFFRFIAVIAIASNTLAGCSSRGSGMWEQVSSSFLKDDRPYGPGDFRIDGNRFITLKVANPEIRFQAMSQAEINDPNAPAKVAEPWMADPQEVAARSTARVLTGQINGQATRVFEEPAQHADWWIAADWSTIYLTTQWQDLRPSSKIKRPSASVTKLWQSSDGGAHWKPLPWPAEVPISTLRFLDGQRGYLIGAGPKLWRTEDGGMHWTKLDLPTGIGDFDLTGLGPTGILYLANIQGDTRNGNDSTKLYSLSWGKSVPSLLTTLPDQLLVNLSETSDGGLLLISEIGTRAARDTGRPLPTVISNWNGQHVELMHRFEPGFRAFAVYRIPSGALLLDGVYISSAVPKEVLAISRDGGKEWVFEVEGSTAQGGYHDPSSNTRWRVTGYTLMKRNIQ